MHKHLLFGCIDVIDCRFLVLDVGEFDLECDVLLLIGFRSLLLRFNQCIGVLVLEISNLDGEVLSDLTRDLFHIGVAFTVVN